MARGGKAGKALRMRNKTRKANFTLYSTQDRYNKNKVKTLTSHLNKHPDDDQAKEALEKAKRGEGKPRSGRSYRKRAAYEYDFKDIQKELRKLRKDILNNRRVDNAERSPLFKGAARVF